MKFSFCFGLLLCLLLAVFDLAYSAPKRYNFVPAKCEVQPTDKDIGGPLRVCTFPPAFAAVPQEDIDAVVEHIQTLNLK